MLPSTLECNFELNFMTRNSNCVNNDYYELRTRYFMSQIIKITCPARLENKNQNLRIFISHGK